jgi:hypothetical protein
MMNLLELLQRAAPLADPLHTGEWATLAFRPDLGSQQEFIVGAAAAIDGDASPYLKWLPTLSKLSSLYGDAISSSEAKELLGGSELAIRASFAGNLTKIDSGTPHLRVIPCGYIATHDIDSELTILLKRHAGAIWAEVAIREDAMDDDWAYSLMRNTLKEFNIFIPNQSLMVGNRNMHIALDNGKSYGNIVSARYATLTTVERHVNASVRQVVAAHNLKKRDTRPALFVVLPVLGASVNDLVSRKTQELLVEVADMGVLQCCDSDPVKLSEKMIAWAQAT